MPRQKKLKKWKVRVLPECADIATEYVVFAVDPLDARTIAFALDGGFPKAMTEMEDEGEIELVKMYTKIIAST